MFEQANQLVEVVVECEGGLVAMGEPLVTRIRDLLRRARHKLDREHRLPARPELTQECSCVDAGGSLGLAQPGIDQLELLIRDGHRLIGPNENQ